MLLTRHTAELSVLLPLLYNLVSPLGEVLPIAMEHSANNRANLTNAIKGLKKIDGRTPKRLSRLAEETCYSARCYTPRHCEQINGTSRRTEEFLRAAISPELAGGQRTLDMAIADFYHPNEDIYANIYLQTEKPNHNDSTGTIGGGHKALQELVGRYNKVIDDVMRATMDKLVNADMKQGHDQDDYFVDKTLAGLELEEMGEPIADRRFDDLCVQGFTLWSTWTSN